MCVYIVGGGIKGTEGEATPLLARKLQESKVESERQRDRKGEGRERPSSVEQGGKKANDHETSKREYIRRRAPRPSQSQGTLCFGWGCARRDQTKTDECTCLLSVSLGFIRVHPVESNKRGRRKGESLAVITTSVRMCNTGSGQRSSKTTSNQVEFV